MKANLIFLSFLAIGIISCRQEEPWVDLFNGETLDGWKVTDGRTDVWVEDGMIIALQTDTANFPCLITEEAYSDFIIELDMKLTGELNKPG